MTDSGGDIIELRDCCGFKGERWQAVGCRRGAVGGEVKGEGGGCICHGGGLSCQVSNRCGDVDAQGFGGANAPRCSKRGSVYPVCLAVCFP